MENNESKMPKESTTTSADKKPLTKSLAATKSTSATKIATTKPENATKSASKTPATKTTAPSASPIKSSTNRVKPSATKLGVNPSNSPSPTKSTPPSSAPKTGSSTKSVKPNPSATKPNELKPQVKEIEKGNLNKNLIAEDNEGDKKKKKKLLLIILFIILGLALIGVGIYFITTIPKSEINFKVEIDAVIDTTFENEYGEIEEYVYYPGDLIKGKLTINIDDLNSTIATSDNVFLRFKVSVEVDDNYYSGLFYPVFNKESDWYGSGAGAGEESADNYYYYCLRCYDNTEITVFDYLDFVKDKDNNMLNGKTAKLIFTVEILEGNYSAIGQEWHTAPDAWRTSVR